ncbi:MAG: hypothetical protein GX574_08635 [Lentisphaerae bacterium]|nr:hypothetical protein [Lentisphaerota bacterium]HQL86801.1 hypothetical protein [Lentisphaeria bacterium]
MTLRALTLAFAAVAVICGFTYFNDAVLYHSMFVGNHIPMSVFGGLFLFLITVNPILRRLSRGKPSSLLRPFTARELCLILAIVLPSCCIPYSSMMRTLPRALMLPHHYAKTNTSWKLQDSTGDQTFTPATTLLPKRMLADPEYDNGNALLAMVQGMPTKPGQKHVSPSAIPWGAWKDTLSLWIPLFLLLWLALGGIAVACHHQWANNEHLPYPIVQFARTIMPEADGAVSLVLRNKWFWLSCVFVYVIHLNNYLYLYHYDYLIPFRRVISLWPISKLIPTFMRGGGWSLVSIRLYFTAIGIAFLIPVDVSMAVGIGPFIFIYIAGVLAKLGTPMHAGYIFSGRISNGLILGGYLAFFAVLLYTGRHYYLNALKGALRLGPSQDVPASAIWGTRCFLVAATAFIASLTALGLDWQLAFIYTALAIALFTVLGRIIAEAGAFHLSPGIYPCALIVAILGEQVLGPSTLVIMFFLTTVFFIDPRECFMPFMVNALHFSASARIRFARVLPFMALAIIVGLCIAIPATLYFTYDRGVNWRDGFASSSVPRYAISSAVAARRRLLAQDTLATSESCKGFQRFAAIKPNKRFMIAFGATFTATILFSVARLRFARWPIHPVLFCLWPGYAGYTMAWSFIIGGTIKILVSHYGGSKFVQKIKPLMIGLIAGDMLAGLTIIASGAMYYFITGTPPKGYWVLP